MDAKELKPEKATKCIRSVLSETGTHERDTNRPCIVPPTIMHVTGVHDAAGYTPVPEQQPTHRRHFDQASSSSTRYPPRNKHTFSLKPIRFPNYK